MFNRTLLFLGGIALAYLALWAGNDLSVLMEPNWIQTDQPNLAVLAEGTMILGSIFAISIGFFTILACVGEIADRNGIDDTDGILMASVAAICVAFLFGEIAQPLAAAGNWWTPWLVLVVLGAVPMISAAKHLIVDLFTGQWD